MVSPIEKLIDEACGVECSKLSKEQIKSIADSVAAEALGHIDMMYPDMWKSVAKSARTSLRNCIRSAVRNEIKKIRHL